MEMENEHESPGDHDMVAKQESGDWCWCSFLYQIKLKNCVQI